MPIESLDPRINRLGIEYERDSFKPLQKMDQLETYEIFTQTKEGKPYEHVGIMHADSNQLAFIEGKEQYGRRGKCFGLWSVKTGDVTLSKYAAINETVWDVIDDISNSDNLEDYDVFIQSKRGKQHKHLCTVKASSPEAAFSEAKKLHPTEKGCNLWTAKTSKILKTNPEEKVLFETAPEKQFREAIIYKIKDRITDYRQKHNMN